MSKLLNTSLDDIFKSTPMGSIDTAIGNAFYGINHRQQPSSIPINKDAFGLIFFTRPQLNFTTENLRSDRKFLPLLTKTDESIERIIRTYLDPRLNTGESKVPCQFVDHQSAFLPILTNHILTCSGWPDIALDSYESKPGSYREVYSQVDSVSDIYSAYNITATFRNMIMDPITKLFFYWTRYQSLVMQGIMVPYPDFIVMNEVDYNTRIYRLALDSNKKYVTKIACTGASYPVSVPLGASFNYEHDKHINLSNNEITFEFKSMGACYQDDIIIYEFNKLVGIFHDGMRGDVPLSTMKKIDMAVLHLFNNRGYPRIDPDSKELEWYVSQDAYQQVSDSYAKHLKALS